MSNFFQATQFLNIYNIAAKVPLSELFLTQIKEFKVRYKICTWSQNHISASSCHTEMVHIPKFLSLHN